MNVIQNSVAVNGTVNAINTQQDLIVLHNVTSLIAALTFTLPANPINGQLVTFSTKGGITLFTITGGTLATTLTTLLGGNTARWVYNSVSSNWFRI